MIQPSPRKILSQKTLTELFINVIERARRSLSPCYVFSYHSNTGYSAGEGHNFRGRAPTGAVWKLELYLLSPDPTLVHHALLSQLRFGLLELMHPAEVVFRLQLRRRLGLGRHQRARGRTQACETIRRHLPAVVRIGACKAARTDGSQESHRPITLTVKPRCGRTVAQHHEAPGTGYRPHVAPVHAGLAESPASAVGSTAPGTPSM